MRDKGGFDLIAQGFAGLMAITGEPGGPPVKTGSPVADINAGILAAVGILAAYVHKQRTGQGQVVDTSLMEAALQQTYWQAAIHFATGESPGPTGSAHLLTAPYQAFAASDGWLNIGGANQANWERIADVLGHPEWRDDVRFASNSARMENLGHAGGADERDSRRTRTRAEWIDAFEQAGVPVGAVQSIGEALAHPQTLARGMVVEIHTRRQARRRRLDVRSIFRRRRHASAVPRRCSASIRASCCVNTVTPQRRSLRSKQSALSNRSMRWLSARFPAGRK